MISTSRLLLRPLRVDDAPVLAAYRSDPEVARYQPWVTPYTVADATELIGDMVQPDPTSPGWFQYGIELLESRALIGDLGVNLGENLMQAEIGFTLDPAYQGKGYGTEAVRGILDHLFTVQGLHKVSAEADARNTASTRLLERAGFQPEGCRRAHSYLKGEWTDDVVFGLLAQEWQR